MSVRACVFGVRVAKLDADWRAFLKEAQPWALILFREACVSRAQVKRLCADLRDALERDAIIFIDQEGGRVARLKSPEWPAWPPPAAYGALYAKDPALALEACRLGFRLIADELKGLGVDGDFAPVLDVPVAGADPIIGDRAFSRDPDAIAALGRAALEALNAGGVAGCIKHMPAAALARDIGPFKALADAPAAMTAHIVYEAWDSDHPATSSRRVIEEVIRGEIGFQGLLMSDDLDMKALQYAMNGTLADRARAALGAGCDVVLQCSGELKDMREAAEGCPPLSGLPLVRARAVEAFAKRAPHPFDAVAGWARFRELLGAE
jgi:beta-N-acetylhexosaminidase